MSRILTLTDRHLPAQSVCSDQPITPEVFEQLCHDHRDLRLELTSTGELIVMPPADSETGVRNANLTYQLANWTRQDGTGLCFDSSAGFTLPNKAIRSPDAAWIKREKWDHLTEQQKEGFAPICPDFVVEIRSRTDSLTRLHSQMQEYMANGASMGWLIDPSRRQVYVYRINEEPVILESPQSVTADPLLPGFKLDTAELW